MLDVVMIDDELDAIQGMKNILEKIDIVEFVEGYQSFEAFCKAAKSGNHYDVILMDINFQNEMSGIDYSKKVFELFPQIKIVFVTGYVREYVSEVFIPKINLAGFIEKPIDTATLEKILLKIDADIYDNKNDVLVLKNRGAAVAMPLHEIVYIESQGHNVVVHMTRETKTFFGKLTDVEKLLPGWFVKCHRSYIVNLFYVKQIGKGNVLLSDYEKTTLSISRILYKRFRDEFFDYMRRTT